jgi:hypothetical protein
MEKRKTFTEYRAGNKVRFVNSSRNNFFSFAGSMQVCVVVLILMRGMAGGAVYEVGPGKSYGSLQEVTGLVHAGDVVKVQGGVTYQGGVTFETNGGAGTGAITVEGVRVNGARPVISGVTENGASVLKVTGNHYLIEGFDITVGGDTRAGRCFYNVGDDVTLRDSVVRDCPFTGISGADASGSFTMDHVEVFHCGHWLFAHQIYVGSSLKKYPRAVFRMQYCYVHDGVGGNNVKSRVTRNVIEYNWIEGAAFHDLDLVGPDPKGEEMPKGGVHCDADVVGNVIVATEGCEGTVVRLGSDGTGASRGRYRIANNTVIVKSEEAAQFGVFWLKGEVDSVGLWNNVFWSEAGALKLVRQEVGSAPKLAGNGNWMPTGTVYVPVGWKAIRGMAPGFANAAAGDYRPAAGSPLIGTGVMPPDLEIVARSVPPARALETGAGVRPVAREKDIGAYPFADGKSVVGQAGTR